MRAVIQRVTEAQVTVGETVVGKIGPGLCILLGVGKGDGKEGAESLARKVSNPADAERLYEFFAGQLRAAGLTVATGQFQAAMKVALVNDGPVTLILES